MDNLKNGLAGGSSAAVAVALLNPLDTLKTRWQTKPQSASFNNMNEFGRQIIRTEGGFIKAMWMPGLLANSTSILVSTSTRMGLYPLFRNTLISSTGAKEKSAWQMFSSGLLAGACGYFLGSPLYQVKNRQQAALPEGRQRTVECIKTLLRDNALFRGASVMVLPTSVLSFALFCKESHMTANAVHYVGTQQRHQRTRVAVGSICKKTTIAS